MSLEVGVNSYIDFNNADDYMSDRLFVDAWDGSGQQTCEKALIMATKKVDALMLSGEKTDAEQSMQFPRNGDTEVPQAVLDAVCEEALAILTGGASASARAELAASGVKSYSIGDLSETLSGLGCGLLSPVAFGLLSPFMGVCGID